MYGPIEISIEISFLISSMEFCSVEKESKQQSLVLMLPSGSRRAVESRKRWEGIPEAMDCCVLIGRRDRQWKQQSPDTAHKGGETSSRKLFWKLRKSHKTIFCSILFPLNPYSCTHSILYMSQCSYIYVYTTLYSYINMHLHLFTLVYTMYTLHLLKSHKRPNQTTAN